MNILSFVLLIAASLVASETGAATSKIVCTPDDDVNYYCTHYALLEQNVDENTANKCYALALTNPNLCGTSGLIFTYSKSCYCVPDNCSTKVRLDDAQIYNCGAETSSATSIVNEVCSSYTCSSTDFTNTGASTECDGDCSDSECCSETASDPPCDVSQCSYKTFQDCTSPTDSNGCAHLPNGYEDSKCCYGNIDRCSVTAATGDWQRADCNAKSNTYHFNYVQVLIEGFEIFGPCEAEIADTAKSGRTVFGTYASGFYSIWGVYADGRHMGGQVRGIKLACAAQVLGADELAVGTPEVEDYGMWIRFAAIGVIGVVAGYTVYNLRKEQDAKRYLLEEEIEL